MSIHVPSIPTQDRVVSVLSTLPCLSEDPVSSRLSKE